MFTVGMTIKRFRDSTVLGDKLVTGDYDVTHYYYYVLQTSGLETAPD